MCPATHFGNEQSMNLRTSRQVLSAKLQACHSGNLKERRKKKKFITTTGVVGDLELKSEDMRNRL